MSSPTVFDVVILGAGSAGYSAALRAAQLGLTVALVEANKVGGTCLHRGCVPTKAMLHVAEVTDQITRAAEIGIETSLAGIDITRLSAYRDGIVDRLHRGLAGLIQTRGITMIEGIGRLISHDTLDVGGQQITGRHIVLATGSRPKSVPGLEIAGHVITSDQALKLEWIPRSAMILGGGVIGVEFASMWRSFGAEVTIVEAMDRIVPAEDAAISRSLERSLTRRGIAVTTSATLAEVVETDAGIAATLADGATIEADLLLVATGRQPNTEGIGLAELGITLDRGFVMVDDHLATGVANIWAIGDIVPGLQLAHRGYAQGIAVAERIAGMDVPPLIEAHIPRVIYSDPEVASIGMTEAQAVATFGENGIDVETHTLGGNARSLVKGTSGMAKAVVVKGGPVVGLHLLGAGVSELIGEAQLIVSWEARPSDVAELVHAHPTQSEILGEVHLALAGKALHG